VADFTHLSEQGTAQMVDVSGKSSTVREAEVAGTVWVNKECFEKLTERVSQEIATTARIAGIQASKATAQLIPFCHQVSLAKVQVDVELLPTEQCFGVVAKAKSTGATGVEMEAFVAAQIAGLTIYDMIKALSPDAVVGPFKLATKTGGKSPYGIA
jgi:cyclic pyranopterin monophosphate synthase